MPTLKSTLRRTRRGAKTVFLHAVERAGYQLTPRHFYSPLPDINALPAHLWTAPSTVPGVDLRVGSALSLLRGPLKPYLAEFHPPTERNTTGQFWLHNGSYESVDAETLYAMLRHLRPSRVYELGSGSSSHVIYRAAVANRGQGAPVAHTIFDPYPFQASPMGPIPEATVRNTRTEDLTPADFTGLQSGDVLFVDTTHTVRTGGDVTNLFLELLPQLNVGVVVHIHDIFLPYEYPKDWIVDERRAWAEQYLLQAFLAFNQHYQVLLPNYAVAQSAPDLLAELIPSFNPHTVRPGGFWMRRS